MEKKNLYKVVLLLSGLLGSICVYIIYHLNISVINNALHEVHGVELVITIILIRITILLGNTVFLFSKWFKQEQQYLSDIPFLFAIFFLFLTFGKGIDLFSDLIYTYFKDSLNLLVIKLRFVIIVFTVFPLIYLSVTMILYSFSLKERFVKLKDKEYMKFEKKIA